MKEQNNNRTKWLPLRLTPGEYEKLHRQFKKTTCRKLSDYARKILLGKPVIATYRNRSLDDFMAEMIQLRGALNSIGNNFNQAVKKLHTLHQIAEFRSWLITYEGEKQSLLNKVEEVKNRINKIADQLYRALDANGNKVGIPIKASDFYGKPTLKFLQEKFVQHDRARQPYKARVKNAIDLTLLKHPRHSVHSLVQSLERDGIHRWSGKMRQGSSLA